MIRTTHPTPVGTFVVVADDDALVALWVDDQAHPPRTSTSVAEGTNAVTDEAIRQLDEWFAGTRTDFDLRLQPVGTPFQQEVWAALRTIPYGETTTYAKIAAAVGRPSAVRGTAPRA